LNIYLDALINELVTINLNVAALAILTKLTLSLSFLLAGDDHASVPKFTTMKACCTTLAAVKASATMAAAQE